MMKLGRCLISVYILAIYCPKTPRKKSWTPLSSRMTQTMDVHPSTESWKTICLTLRATMAIKEIAMKSSPSREARARGRVEKARMPSSE